MEDAKTVKVLIFKEELNKTLLKTDKFPYRKMVGNLLYTSSSKTRPDICTQLVSRFVEGYSQERINDIKHILKYLNGNVDRNIKYKKNRNISLLEAYLDAYLDYVI